MGYVQDVQEENIMYFKYAQDEPASKTHRALSQALEGSSTIILDNVLNITYPTGIDKLDVPSSKYL